VRADSLALHLPDEMRTALCGAGPSAAAGREFIFGIRPESICRAEAAAEGRTARVLVEVVEPVGGEAYLHLKLGEASLIARVDDYEGIAVGPPLEVTFALDRARLFDRRDEKVIA